MEDAAETKKKKRGSNYTASEKDFLLSLVQNYIDIIENKVSNATTAKRKKHIWEKIATNYNEYASSGNRTWLQLRHLYDNIKHHSKKSNATQNGYQLHENIEIKEEQDNSYDSVHPYVGDIDVSVSVDEASNEETLIITPKIEADAELDNINSYNYTQPIESPSIIPKQEVDFEMRNSFDEASLNRIPNRSPNIQDSLQPQPASLHPSTNEVPYCEANNDCAPSSIADAASIHKENSENLKKWYFKMKLKNAKLESRYLINKNKRENNLYKLQLEILKTKLNKLKSQKRN